MHYDESFVIKVVESVRSGRSSRRKVARLFTVSRDTVNRWVRRIGAGLPSRFTRAAQHVWNQTPALLQERLKALLGVGKNAVSAWIGTGQRVSLRTVQRWKARWFPRPKARKRWRRYERRKALSLAHTDWAEKRITDGKRICFTFAVDDATRMVFAARAVEHADQLSTAEALWSAVRETGGFRQVLTDCGAVYGKAWGMLCQDVGVEAIHTRPYHPQCNGKAEAVVKKAKAFLNRSVVKDLAHANQLLKEFQQEHNRTPHSGLKYRTPLQVYRAKRRAGLIWAVT